MKATRAPRLSSAVVFLLAAVGCTTVTNKELDGGTPTCSDLETDYLFASPAAQSCTLGAPGQCQMLATGSLSACSLDCLIFVNDATTVNALKARWQALGCGNKTQVCPAIACLTPTSGTCIPVIAGSGGTCQTSGPTTN